MSEMQKGSTDIRGFVTHVIDEIESLKTFTAAKRNALITEMAGFFSDEEKQMASKVSQGKHLFVAREIAGTTFKELTSAFGIKYELKAKRLIGLYERLAKMLPPEGLVTAPSDIGGIDPQRPLGMYHAIIDEKSLPKSRDLVVWKKFWAGVEERKSEIWAHSHRPRTKSPDLIKRVMLLEIRRRLGQIAAKDREHTYREVVGMTMPMAGIKSETKFKPVEIPDGYIPKRGRPVEPPKKKAPKGGD